MSELHIHAVPDAWAKRAYVDNAKYKAMYERSVKDPDGFWGEHGKRIDWIKPFTKVKNTTYGPPDVSIKWFEDGTTNVAMNCVDRHLEKRGDQVAIIWEGDDPNESRKHHLQGIACRSVQVRQCPAQSRGQERRHGHHLHADDTGSSLCDAGMRPHRRRAFHRFRWLLSRLACRTHQGLPFESRHHRRRGFAWRPEGSAESQCRCCN